MNDTNKKYLISEDDLTKIVRGIFIPYMFDSYYQKRKVIEEELLTRAFDIDMVQGRLKDVIRDDFVEEYVKVLLDVIDGYEYPQQETEK